LTEFFLWLLFHIRTDVEEKDEVLEELNGELEDSSVSVEEATEKVRLAKKEASAARNVSSKLDKKRVKIVAEIDQAQPSIIKTEEEIKNFVKKIAAEKRKHAKIVKESEAREETLENLEKEIKEYSETEEHLQQEYEELKTRGDVALTEEQEAEYERVREAAAVASAKPRHALGSANRKLESARVKAAGLSEEMKEFTARKTEASNKVIELTERRDKLEEVRILCFPSFELDDIICTRPTHIANGS